MLFTGLLFESFLHTKRESNAAICGYIDDMLLISWAKEKKLLRTKMASPFVKVE